MEKVEERLKELEELIGVNKGRKPGREASQGEDRRKALLDMLEYELRELYLQLALRISHSKLRGKLSGEDSARVEEVKRYFAILDRKRREAGAGGADIGDRDMQQLVEHLYSSEG